jgi:diacylglycerol kinase (ATP)
VSTPFQARGQGTFFSSVLHAWNGLVWTVVHQRNMRMHLLSGVLVSLVGGGIPLGLAEKVTMIFCVLMILFAEMLNSALEQLVDLAIQQFDEKARLTKDIAAAGVLVLAIGTVVIFAAILVHNSDAILEHLPEIQRQVIYGVPLTVGVGVLMHEAKKPLALDAAVLVVTLGLWASLAQTSFSYVFSAMTLGLIVLAANAGWSRQRSRRAGAPPS